MKTGSVVILIIVLLSGLISSCDDRNIDNYDDIEINIVEYSKERIDVYENRQPRFDYLAVISYTVENVGTKVVDGWEIFFNVALTAGPNITATDNSHYTLEPGMISSIKEAKGTMIELYEDESVRGASLKNIETW